MSAWVGCQPVVPCDELRRVVFEEGGYKMRDRWIDYREYVRSLDRRYALLRYLQFAYSGGVLRACSPWTYTRAHTAFGTRLRLVTWGNN